MYISSNEWSLDLPEVSGKDEIINPEEKTRSYLNRVWERTEKKSETKGETQKEVLTLGAPQCIHGPPPHTSVPPRIHPGRGILPDG